MARALIVGCGCRGRALGRVLGERGWAVRGTSRDGEGAAAISAAGLDPAVADPDHPGTVLELVGDVTVIHWLLGSARGELELIAGIHGPRLASLLARLVDTPVRGFVYEAAGSVPPEHLRRGAGLVESAAARWRIPVEIVAADPARHEAWLAAMLTATSRVLSQHRAA